MTTSTFSRISGYLQNSNWEIFDNIDNKLFFFQSNDSKRILQLYDDSIPGADRYFEDAITFLAEKENKSKSSFLNLFCSEQGVMQIRVPIESGEIDMETSVKLRETAISLLLSTAHSSVERKISHPGLNKKNPTEKIKACKEIPTLAGSYIVTILIPEDTGILNVTQQALKKTTELANADYIPATTDHMDIAEKGISSNFLDSFNYIADIAEKEGIEISFASENDVFECNVNKAFCDYVKQLSRSFTSKEEERIVEIVGTVKNNGWNPKDKIGTIRVTGEIDGLKKKAEFILHTKNIEFYELARDAEFPSKKKIRAKGTLIPGTRPARISDLTELKVIE